MTDRRSSRAWGLFSRGPHGQRFGAEPSGCDRVREVGDARSLDDAKLLEADLSRKAIEEPNTVAQDDRGQVDLDLVEPLGLKRLPEQCSRRP